MEKIFNKKWIGILIGVVAFCALMIGLIVMFFPEAVDDSRSGRGIGFYVDGKFEGEEGGGFVMGFGKGGKRKVFSESLALEKEENILVVSDVTDVKVLPHDGERLDIEYEAYEDSTFEVSRREGQIEITAKIHPKRRSPQRLHLLIRCPRDWDKDLEIRSDVGDLKLEGDYRKLRLRSDVGNIDVKGSAERMDAEVSVGDLRAAGSFGSADLQSDVGSIDFATDRMTEGVYELKSDVGDIDVRIPQDADVSMQAEVEVGSLSCTAKLDQIRQTGVIEKSLTAKNRDGRAKLQISADTGSISIKN
ncbi:MAG: DUF4097 family beta strand repeat-containing protein [Peptostreptococcaceae bacterium]|nr:DUF4097 family beta strand repeat-containing protein [Peptostreptococcaceae bacterium]